MQFGIGSETATYRGDYKAPKVTPAFNILFLFSFFNIFANKNFLPNIFHHIYSMGRNLQKNSQTASHFCQTANVTYKNGRKSILHQVFSTPGEFYTIWKWVILRQEISTPGDFYTLNF